MKPAKFDYYDPSTLDEAIDLMARFGDEARPLAGGQSLVPLMNFRLIRPAKLIDLNRVAELNYVDGDDCALSIGAMTRQRQLERSREIAERCPLIAEAAGFIGHVQIRTRGTIGGSLAHAFPSAELPVAMLALEADFTIRSQQRRRVVKAEEFFLSYMTTALEPGELLTQIEIAAMPAYTGWSYQEVSRRHGDFALAGAAALVSLDANGRIRAARLALTGTVPVRARKFEAMLIGEKSSDVLFKRAAHMAVAATEQDSDIHASAEYRKAACQVMGVRALTRAAERAAQTLDNRTS
jgi:aerobic carbon-monoxide dehydrogenase medium subunit